MSSTQIADGQTLLEPISAALTQAVLPFERMEIDAATITEAAHALCAIAARRSRGEPAIAIDSQGTGQRRGPAGHRMTIALVNDDMPFLVDSVAACLARHDLVIHRLLHPVVGVERDADGMLTEILPPDSPGSRRESMIFLETDRASARARHQLEHDLHETLDHVRVAVRDWAAMQAALRGDAEAMADPEAAALLRWLLDRHMTQTGHARIARNGTPTGQLGICTLADGSLLSETAIKAAFAWFEEGGRQPLIVKSNRISRIHRPGQIDLFIVPVREGGKLTALSLHAGIWTSAALATPPDRVPVLRAALSALMHKYGFAPEGHDGKALYHALTALPHDIVIGFDHATVERLALTLMSLSDRPRPRLVTACAPLGRHLYAFIWLPRDEVSTARRVAIQDMLTQATGSPMLSWSFAVEEGGMALLRITLDLREGCVMPDETLLDRQLAHMVRGWVPAVEAALADFEEAGRSATLAERYAAAFPIGYRIGAGPDEAALDIAELYQLKDADDRRVRLYRNEGDAADRLRIKLYGRSAIALSDAIPALENFGFLALEEVTTALDDGRLGHIHRIVVARRDGEAAAPLIERADALCAAISAVLTGASEDDRFNELVVSAALAPPHVDLLRALFRYLRQTGTPYGMGTFAEALQQNNAITTQLITLFEAEHAPTTTDREGAARAAEDAIETALKGVSAIDEDRVLRLLLATIRATLRTNFYVPAGQEALAFKFDSAQIPGLPAPLPWREIWVHSRRVEGIHLRAGPVARGGLRWSDRRDDFRTEILDLMKAQRVKNAVIVPTGAKGGFYPKRLPNPAQDRDAWLAEGTESYRIFVRALLSLTDNIVKGETRHPKGIVIRDGDDPYFVVAADKGTATFSDVANALALECGFWLGDAFASGGSHGYDHKAMGITARGAWISVQRHFAEMGIDVQTDSIRVVGCGDMSGDVFGNGMLLSQAIKLVAAFDHRHIFLDPDPDPAKAWTERKRMFALPRSSWDDYNKALISKGGGVFPRSAKSVPLSPQVQAMLETTATEMEPTALISALLKAPVHLLWFGGIGTYVKAAHQSHADVRDPTNDAVRVNGAQVRAKVIGEGANLGVTQAGRIEFALSGGAINTDFIDNSAGVDCSDNEVNIKIALNTMVGAGSLTLDERNALLIEMTDDVAALVLDDNRAQALGLSIAQAGGAAAVPAYLNLINGFVATGKLDRAVEGLASDIDLTRRAQEGFGLTRPELAVLLSTTKLALQSAIEAGHIGDDGSMDGELALAFPPRMRERAAEPIRTHALRGPIIATMLANRMINRLGLLHPFELQEQEGRDLSDIATAFVVTERLFDLRALWERIDASAMPEGARIAVLGAVAKGTSSLMAEIIRALPVGAVPADGEALLEAGIAALLPDAASIRGEASSARVEAAQTQLAVLGVPDDLASQAAALLGMDGLVGLALLAQQRDNGRAETAASFLRLGEALGLDWLQAQAARLSPSDPWERMLLAGVGSGLQRGRLALLGRLGADIESDVTRWLESHGGAITQYRGLLDRARAAPNVHVAMLAELAAKARGLLEL